MTSSPLDGATFRVVGGQHGYRHLVAELADGRRAFVKAVAGAEHRFAESAAPATEITNISGEDGEDDAAVFAAEGNGLRWLGEAEGGAAVPHVIEQTAELLAIEYLEPGTATKDAAEDFGRALARTHRTGAGSFGARWAGRMASLPLDNTLTPASTAWGEWWGERRAVPYIRRAADDELLSAADLSLAETVAAKAAELGGPHEPPARVHGDLWSGNLAWSGGRGWLIDPAAHGGHRESDLAMLDLFGAPHLDTILGAYDEEFPLSDGWRERIPLHQVHPLLVHVCLFGGGYADWLRRAARAALRGLSPDGAG